MFLFSSLELLMQRRRRRRRWRQPIVKIEVCAHPRLCFCCFRSSFLPPLSLMQQQHQADGVNEADERMEAAAAKKGKPGKQNDDREDQTGGGGEDDVRAKWTRVS